MIKIINKRIGGSLFHYAHFLIDCLYPEIVQDVHLFQEVVREKNIDQTIGNFHSIYTDVTHLKNTELNKTEFDSLQTHSLVLKNKEEYTDILHLNKFRDFIFSRYSIYDHCISPEIILIKRGDRISLIDDPELKQINTNVTTGKERREIDRVDELEQFLQHTYKHKFQAVFLEHLPFEQQVKLFYNCKTVIAIHGAAMANVLFCKENTKFIEIVHNMRYEWFDTVFRNLNIHHIKCANNRFDEIVLCLKENII